MKGERGKQGGGRGKKGGGRVRGISEGETESQRVNNCVEVDEREETNEEQQ